MTTLSYASIKTSSVAKENEERRTEAREKALLLFTFQLLVDKGYVATASSFASECSLDLNQYVICENIDLHSIFVEFETFHNMKFQRYPQYFRKISNSGGSSESVLSKLQMKSSKQVSAKARAQSCKPRRAQLEGEDGGQNGFSSDNGFEPAVKPIQRPMDTSSVSDVTLDGKLLKPISGLEFPTEDMRSFAEMIQRDIVVNDLGVRWDHVVGLDNAKMILMESLLYSREFTNFFGNAFPPWRGLLLYGPPGNGKTLLAKAVANECKTTFFNISSSSVVSKWRGDSEKIIKVLFDLAKYHAPSTIFFDEFDALGSNRDSGGESDASRRLKSELLQQMDGLLSQNEHPVFILAATNIPWDLDSAILRRLEKRIFVPLPDIHERGQIVHCFFKNAVDSVAVKGGGKNEISCKIDFETIAAMTEGYSASDLHHIVKESIVKKYRQQFSSKIKKLLVQTEDVKEAIQALPPTVKAPLNEKFRNWDARFGTI